MGVWFGCLVVLVVGVWGLGVWWLRRLLFGVVRGDAEVISVWEVFCTDEGEIKNETWGSCALDRQHVGEEVG